MVCCIGAIFTVSPNLDWPFRRLLLIVLDITQIDRYGRRKVLMVGAVGQSLCFFLLGALSKVGADQHSASIGAAAGSFIFIFNAVFALTWLSVPWVCESIPQTFS